VGIELARGDRSAPDVAAVIDAAVAAESAGADLLVLSGTGSRAGFVEPLPLLAAASAHTRTLGLVAQISTDRTHPTNIARRVVSADRVSGGRVGWWPITDGQESRHAEALDVAAKLWHSWQPGALVLDKARGLAFDPDLIAPIDHSGPHFKVAGPFDFARSRQGRVLTFAAGSPADWSRTLAGLVDVVLVEATDETAVREALDGVAAALAEVGRSREDVVAVLRTPAQAVPDAEQIGGWIREGLLDGVVLVIDLPSAGEVAHLPEVIGELLGSGSEARASRSGDHLRGRLGLTIPEEWTGATGPAVNVGAA